MNVDLARMTRERRARLFANMQEQGIDALLLLGASNQEYAGVSRAFSDAMRVFYEASATLLTATGDVHVWTPFPEAVSEVPPDQVHRELPLELVAGVEALARGVREVAPDARRVAVDELTSPMVERLARLVAPADLVDARPVVVPARMVKTADEVECLRVSQSMTETAMYDAQALLRPGVRQNELSAAFFRRAFELGMTWSCIDPIWSVTPRFRNTQVRTVNGDVGFPLVTDDRLLSEGDLVLVDVGLVWNGYHSDFGKTWVCSSGSEPEPGLKSCFERWRALVDVAIGGVRPGRTCADLARDVAAVEPDYKLSHFYLAHGVGCDSAEMPFIGSELGPAVEDTLELVPGMAFVLEPVIWVDGVGGYRSEELVVVTDSGCEQFSTYGYSPFE